MDFLKRKGYYRHLIVYKKAGCIYDIIPPDINLLIAVWLQAIGVKLVKNIWKEEKLCCSGNTYENFWYSGGCSDPTDMRSTAAVRSQVQIMRPAIMMTIAIMTITAIMDIRGQRIFPVDGEDVKSIM